jgi:hypothetical protein
MILLPPSPPLPHSVFYWYSVYWSVFDFICRYPLHTLFTWFLWFVQSRSAVKSNLIWNAHWDEKEQVTVHVQQPVLFSNVALTSVHSVLEQCVDFQLVPCLDTGLTSESCVCVCVCVCERRVTLSSFAFTNNKDNCPPKYCDDCVR